ncbi:MAG: class I SAM-dependent RNA methyltransferase, partial [Candidatus Delongbacteria bacterium]|nr:class I SAM-dependent RNA methyltransferase [Candidatus Delongbacteria bacterium]
MEYNLFATCTFGLESVLKREISELGYIVKKTDTGRIYFDADETAIARSNIFLRTADRVHIVLKEFPANNFDELFDGVKSIAWEDVIDNNGRILVKGRSKNSKIHSVPVAQAMTKKAIIERLRLKLNKTEIIEDGALFPVEIELNNDTAGITLNTSGEPLFKRGYREETGEAPIKETLAAGLVLLSGWNANDPLIDPFCGSGTIPIEAAMIKKRIAPGLNRHFLSMKWNFLNKSIWNQAAEEALDAVRIYDGISIYGYDNNPEIIKKAIDNSI